MTTNTNITNLVQNIGNFLKAHAVFINGNVADLSALNTANKTNLVAAINSVQTALNALATSQGAQINDAATSLIETWSSTKISEQIATALNALSSGAPGALDTLDELAAALGDDANFAATIAAALSNRVRVDAAQTLTAPQKVQANANIGAVSLVEFGSLDTDYVAILNAAMV